MKPFKYYFFWNLYKSIQVNDDIRTFINKFYGHLSTGDNVPKVEEISLEEANVILVSASPKEVQAVVKNAPRIAPQLTETSKTLLIYPPPPMKGGISITVDDYQVLEEESFLNDVIIDFYLKWVSFFLYFLMLGRLMIIKKQKHN